MSSEKSPIPPRDVTIDEFITLLGERNFMLGKAEAQDYPIHHSGYWNGMIQALALAMYFPEYAQARFAQLRDSVVDPEFFRDFQREKAHEIVEEFPL